MPAGEALVSVRETASHTGQPTPVRPTFVVLLVRDRVVGQRLAVAFRPMPVHVVYCVAELRAAMAQHLGAVACVVAWLSTLGENPRVIPHPTDDSC